MPDTTIRAEDWDGRDLRGESHERVTFVDLDMTEVRNGGSVFTGCTFRGVRFNASTHTEADLSGADCAGASFRDVDLSGAALHRADLSRCDLRGSDLSSLDPLATTLSGAVIDPVQAVTLATALGLEVRS